MFGGASEEFVVVEIEVDDLAVAVHRDAGNVVPDVTIPIDAGAIRIVDHVAAIACGWRRRRRRLDLLDTPGIGAERPALVAVPEANHQLHQQIAVDQMTFPGPLLRKFGRRTAEIDIDDFVERLVPIELDRLLVLEARRRLLGRGLGQGRRRHQASLQRRRRLPTSR